MGSKSSPPSQPAIPAQSAAVSTCASALPRWTPRFCLRGGSNLELAADAVFGRGLRVEMCAASNRLTPRSYVRVEGFGDLEKCPPRTRRQPTWSRHTGGGSKVAPRARPGETLAWATGQFGRPWFRKPPNRGGDSGVTHPKEGVVIAFSGRPSAVTIASPLLPRC